MFLLTKITLNIIELSIIFYIIIILNILFIYFYLYSININYLIIIKRGIYLTKNEILLLLKIFYYLAFYLLKIFKFSVCTLFFGHFLLTTFTYHIIIFIFLILFFILHLIILSKINNIKKLLTIIIICIFLAINLCLLWCSLSYFSIVFNLDCMNLLILMLLILDLQYITENDINLNSNFQLIGISIFFWTSFIATMLFFIGGLFLLEYFFTSNLNIIFLFKVFLNTTLFLNTTQYNLYILFFILGLFLKAGLGPLFIWKRYTFTNLKFISLMVYMFFYFSFIFMYIIYILLVLVELSKFCIICLFIIFLILTIIWICALFENGVRIGDFFVFSTLLNTTLVLGVIVSLILYI